MNIWKYLGWFAFGCLAMAAITTAMDLATHDDSWFGGGMAWAVVGASPVAVGFVSDHRRVPTARERRILAAGCIGVYVSCFAAALAGAWVISSPWTRDAIDDIGGMALGIGLLGVVMPAIVVWLVLYVMPVVKFRHLVNREVGHGDGATVTAGGGSRRRRIQQGSTT